MATDASATRLILGKADHGRVVSADAFYHAEFDEPWTYEREDGRLVVMAPEGTGHVRRSNSWRDRLVHYQYENLGIIEEIVGQAWVRPDGKTDRMGDLGVYLVVEGRDFSVPEGPPDLMIEIVSAGKRARERDHVKKRAEYKKLGIREYVLVDQKPKRMTVLELGPDGYFDRAVLGDDDIYTSPLLPGLAIRLAEVLS